MVRQEVPRQSIVLEGPPLREEEPRCKVCGQPLPGWQPGMPLVCDDHNPSRRGPTRVKQERPSVLFDGWIQGTLWYVAAP